MLEDFLVEQKIATQVLKNEIKNNKISHAFLIESNGYDKVNEFVMSFVKNLLCPYKNSKNKQCVNCTQCKSIDNENFTELKIINPDGMWIKKEQTDSIQKEFLTKSVQSNYRIYIINEAEKLNSSSANSILKFLEEPSENIIAILVANNSYKVMNTIRSRCQIISLKNNNFNDKTAFIQKINKNEEEFIEMKKCIINFAKNIEEKKYDTILFIEQIWNQNFKNREEYINAFDLLLIYYKDIINYKIKRQLLFFENNEIITIFDNVCINNIISRINYVTHAKNDIITNGNLNLAMDKLIIDLSGGLK